VIASEYSLDLSTGVTVVGHSAGGHLALWVGGRKKLQPGGALYVANPLPVKAVVSLAGIPDLEQAIAKRVCGDLALLLMGGSPDSEPTRYAEGSPRDLIPLEVPQTFVSGFEDPIVPLVYVSGYVKVARYQGDWIDLRAFNETGHFEVATPLTEAGKWAVAAVGHFTK
jgi:pimeloyl-ACP methyl ester carboxylesterase